MRVQESGVGARVVDEAAASHADAVLASSASVSVSEEAALTMRKLIDVCTNRTRHVGMGMCPDSIEGHDVRDDECPACSAIVAAEHLLAQCGH